MKVPITLLLIISFAQQFVGQNFLVPIKQNEKFGLINNEKKIIIQPIYKNIEYITKDFFEATTETTYIERILFNGKEQDYKGKLILKSLLKKDKILIKEKSIEKFIIKDNYIIGVNNFRNFNKTYNQHKKYEQIRSYSLLFANNGLESELGELLQIEEFHKTDNQIIFRIQKFDKKFDLIVYDFKKNKVLRKIISNSDSYFFVRKETNGQKERLVITYENTGEMFTYQIINGSVEVKPIKLEIKPSTNIYSASQKTESKINNSNQINNNKTPKIIADSIVNEIRIYEIENNVISLNPDTGNLFFYNTKPLVLIKNNKLGLYNIDHSEIIPMIYDSIGYNGMVLLIKNDEYHNKKRDYFVLQKDKLYGILNVNLIDDTQIFKASFILNPILKNFPIYYYDNYFGIKDFKLFKVIDDNGNLLQYCDEKGNCY